MLKRLLTGIILAPLVLAFITYSSSTAFALVIGILFCLMLHEGMPLIPIKKWWLNLVLLAGNVLLLALIYLTDSNHYLLNISAGVWCLIALMVLIFPRHINIWGHRPLVVTLLWLVLCGAFEALTQLKAMPKGHEYLIYLMFLIWAADSGAYFFGKAFGRHKMIKNVSPGKTLEGLMGGALSVFVVTLIADIHFSYHHRLDWYLLAALVFVSSVFGDLFISMLKRRVHVKDTGHILPGHGGLLDRLDSLLSASVFFILGASWLQIYS